MLIKNHPKSIWRKIDDLQKFVSIRCCHSLKSDLESIVISLYFRTKLCTYTETLKVILILQNHIFPKNEKKKIMKEGIMSSGLIESRTIIISLHAELSKYPVTRWYDHQTRHFLNRQFYKVDSNHCVFPFAI